MGQTTPNSWARKMFKMNGRSSSTVFKSEETRFNILPAGVLSKNINFPFMMEASSFLWTVLAAHIPPYANRKDLMMAKKEFAPAIPLYTVK